MGAKIKGITIEIGGKTTELQSSLKAASDKGREAASELSKINSSLKFNPDNVDLLGQKMDVLRDRISATEDTLNTLKNAQGSIEEQFKKGDIGADQYREFQRELIETESKLENFKDQLTKTEKDVKQHDSVMGKLKDAYEDVKDKANKLKEAHPHLTSALEKTGDAAKKVASGSLKAIGTAATSSVAGITALTAGAAKLASELYEDINEIAAYGDNIDKMSQKMGISTEGYQEWDFVMQHCGTSMESLKASMKTMSTAAETNSKAFEKLGISQKEISNLSQEELFNVTISALQNVESETERTYLAGQLLGKGATELGALLNMSAEETETMKQQIHDLGGVMSNDAVAAAAAYEDSLQNLQTAAQGTKNDLLSDFLPGVTQVMDGITALLVGDEGATKQIESGIENIILTVSDKIPEVTNIFSEISGTAAEVAPEIILSLTSGILDNLDELTNSAFTMLDTLTEGLLTEENINKLVTSAVRLVSNLAVFLGDNSELVVDSAFILIKSLIDGLLDNENAGKLVDSTLDIVTSLVTGLIDHAPDMIEGAFSLIGALVGALVDYDWWSVARNIFNGIKSGLKQLITGEAEDSSNKASGSHAGGLAYVPYDGYISELHEGERILTAAENRNYNRERQEKEAEFATLNRKIDAVTSSTQAASKRPINIIATGTARGIARGLTYYVEEEENRQGVIKRNK